MHPHPQPLSHRMGEGGRRPGEGRAADVEVFHRRHADDGGGINGVFAVRDGGDVEDRIRLGQRVIAGVVAERAFVAQRFGRVNVAFDVEVGVGGDFDNASGLHFAGKTSCFNKLVGMAAKCGSR